MSPTGHGTLVQRMCPLQVVWEPERPFVGSYEEWGSCYRLRMTSGNQLWASQYGTISIALPSSSHRKRMSRDTACSGPLHLDLGKLRVDLGHRKDTSTQCPWASCHTWRQDETSGVNCY